MSRAVFVLLIALVAVAAAAPIDADYAVGSTSTTYRGFKDAHEDIIDAADDAADGIEHASDAAEDTLEATAHRGVSQLTQFTRAGARHLRKTAARGIVDESRTAQEAVRLEHTFVKKALDDIDAAAQRGAALKLKRAQNVYEDWSEDGGALVRKYKNVLSSVASTGVKQEEAATAVAIEAVQAAANEAEARKKAAAGASLLEVDASEDEVEDAVLSALEHHFSAETDAAYADAAVAGAVNRADVERRTAQAEVGLQRAGESGASVLRRAADGALAKAKAAGADANAAIASEERAIRKAINQWTQSAVDQINAAGSNNHGGVAGLSDE